MVKIAIIILIFSNVSCGGRGSSGSVQIPPPPPSCQASQGWDEQAQTCVDQGLTCEEGLRFNKQLQRCELPASEAEICIDSGLIWDESKQQCLQPDEVCPSGTCSEVKAECNDSDRFWFEEEQGCYDSEEAVCTKKDGIWTPEGCNLKLDCSTPLKWSSYHYQCIDEDWFVYGIEDRFDVAQYHLQTAKYNYLFYWLDAINDLDLKTAYPAVEIIKVEKSSGRQVWARTYEEGHIYHEIVSLAEDSDGNLVFLGNKKDSYASSSRDDDIVYGKINGQTGDLMWSNFSFGTAYSEEARVVLIGNDGEYFIMGNTQGSLSGQLLGKQDIFIRAINPDDGSVIWQKQGFGAEWESLESAIVKDKNIILTHFTYDEFTRVGDTMISIFDTTNRSNVTTKVIGESARLRLKGLALDGDDLYITGYTTVDFVNGSYNNNTDTIYAKLSYPDLDYIWKQQLGSANWDYMYQVAVARGDYIYFSGTTQGNLWTDGSQKNTNDSEDGIVTKLDKATGVVAWIRRMIEDSPTIGNISSGPKGELYYSSARKGGLLSTGLRDYDAIIKRITPEG